MYKSRLKRISVILLSAFVAGQSMATSIDSYTSVKNNAYSKSVVHLYNNHSSNRGIDNWGWTSKADWNDAIVVKPGQTRVLSSGHYHQNLTDAEFYGILGGGIAATLASSLVANAIYNNTAATIANNVAILEERLTQAQATEAALAAVDFGKVYGKPITGSQNVLRAFYVSGEKVARAQRIAAGIPELEAALSAARAATPLAANPYTGIAITISVLALSATIAILRNDMLKGAYLYDQLWMAPEGADHGDPGFKKMLTNMWEIQNNTQKIRTAIESDTDHSYVSDLIKPQLIKKAVVFRFVDIESQDLLRVQQFIIDGSFLIPYEFGGNNRNNNNYLIDSWGVGSVTLDNDGAFATDEDRSKFEQACYVYQSKNPDKKVYIFNNYWQNDDEYKWWDDIVSKKRDSLRECLETINKLNFIFYVGTDHEDETAPEQILTSLNNYDVIMDSGKKSVYGEPNYVK
ncbi:hypothetical protein [Francisella philomiragia]|uniref:hypothetical protein n=1 Tax=Francisella philomiragia TaxID=28110 RepID=UPI001B8AC713|nr:hypothetical protein [Francisella philomiragia]QUE31577.1 hypothetical protein IMS64_00805 [Francisella philomiragia]